MYTAWTQNLKTDEEKDRFEKSFNSSKRVLERFQEILTESLTQLEASETSLKDYESPNWEYRQAHRNGEKACLKRIIKLADPDQNKKDTQ